MGTPKALLRDGDGLLFATRAISVLRDGGCSRVVVVVGAKSAQVTALLRETPGDDEIVVAEDWDEGMGASLRSGLRAVWDTDAGCAIVSLVDLPDVGAPVVRRLLETAGCETGVLARAAYDAVPGHPVLLGRDHWAGVMAAAHGDRGARDYLTAHVPALVECGDLATGHDADTPDQLI